MQNKHPGDIAFYSTFPKGIYIIIQPIHSVAHLASLDQWITGNLGLSLDESLFMFQHTDNGSFFRGGNKGGRFSQVMQST